MQIQHNSYALVPTPVPAHREWDRTRGERGRAQRSSTHDADPGVQNFLAVTELLKPHSCQHETTQQQLCSGHMSAQYSGKSIQLSNKMFGCLLELQPWPNFQHSLLSWLRNGVSTSVASMVLLGWCPRSLTLLQERLNSAIGCLGVSLPSHSSASLRAWCHALCSQLLPPTRCGDRAYRRPRLPTAVVGLSITT